MNAKGQLEKDEFQPAYELECSLPDVPAQPKLFKRIENDVAASENKQHLYEYSSIEMTQEMSGASNQIYTDYNIGMRVNLVDRSCYKPDEGPKD